MVTILPNNDSIGLLVIIRSNDNNHDNIIKDFINYDIVAS